MLAARFYQPRDVRVEEVPDPEPGPGDVVIRVRNCSLCGADLKTIQHGHHRLSPPRVLGHEIAGEVVSAGAEVTGWFAGDSVQVIAAIPCGACRECQAGHTTVCTRRENMGYQHDGGFAEFMLVPAKVIAVGGLNRIPDGTGPAEASLAEPLACVLNAQELCGVTSGDEVLIIGDGRGADVVIAAAGSGTVQEQAIGCAAPRGRVSLYSGLPPGTPPPVFDTNHVHYHELTVSGTSGASPAQTAHALGLIASGAVPVTDLITHHFPLAQFASALTTVASGQAIKVTIEP
ncbi:MAG TPA: alcohol dehydrogenase catalytic domain-containing protein [Streptosporangiaceae bacterium]|jgi:L-iditol 2-dehydrogenase